MHQKTSYEVSNVLLFHNSEGKKLSLLHQPEGESLKSAEMFADFSLINRRSASMILLLIA